MVNVHEVRHEYEKQSHVYVPSTFNLCNKYIITRLTDFDNFRRAALAEELSVLRQVDEFAAKGLSPPRGKNGFARYIFFLHVLFNFAMVLIYKFMFSGHHRCHLMQGWLVYLHLRTCWGYLLTL